MKKRFEIKNSVKSFHQKFSVMLTCAKFCIKFQISAGPSRSSRCFLRLSKSVVSCDSEPTDQLLVCSL